MTKKLIVEISDELDKSFREAVIRVFGFKKGVIKKAVTEALEMWIARHRSSR